LETRDVSMTILDARFDLLRKDIAAQLATCSGVRENLQKELGGGEAFLATDRDLRACIKTTSSHVERLERLQEKWTAMQAAQGSSTEQFQEVVRELGAVTQELGALPQSSDSPSGSVLLHTLAHDGGAGQISQTPGNDLGRCVRSLGDGFARKAGIVNSRIQHFEGRIQEVVRRPTLPDGMQQIVSLDAHLPPPEYFHALQQAALSPHGETQTTTVTATPRVAAMPLPLPSHAATMEQCVSSPGRNAYATSMRILGDSSEISPFPWASLDQDSLNVNFDVSSKTRSKEEPQLCLTRPNPVSMSFTPAPNTVPSMVLTPRSPPLLFTHAALLSSP